MSTIDRLHSPVKSDTQSYPVKVLPQQHRLLKLAFVREANQVYARYRPAVLHPPFTHIQRNCPIWPPIQARRLSLAKEAARSRLRARVSPPTTASASKRCMTSTSVNLLSATVGYCGRASKSRQTLTEGQDSAVPGSFFLCLFRKSYSTASSLSPQNGDPRPVQPKTE